MLAEKPDIPADYSWYIDAFITLSNGRPLGEFDGAIPLSDIAAYMDIFGIDDDDEKEEFVSIIRMMDGAYLKERAEVMRRARNSKTQSSSRRGGR